MKKLAVVVAALALAGCAGREGHPVPITESYDSGLSCQQIQAEIQGNESKARQLADEKEAAHNTNIAVGAVGVLLFWPALFALDLSDAEREEMDALRQRDGHLAMLADSHGCNKPPEPPAQTAAAAAPAAAPAATPAVATVAAATPASATATAAAEPPRRWRGEAGHDACGVPYSMDLLVSKDMVSGTVRRGDLDYRVSGRLSYDGKLENTLAPAVSPPAGQPANLNLNLQFRGEAAGTGGYSTFDGNNFSCTTVVTLQQA